MNSINSKHIHTLLRGTLGYNEPNFVGLLKSIISGFHSISRNKVLNPDFYHPNNIAFIYVELIVKIVFLSNYILAATSI